MLGFQFAEKALNVGVVKAVTGPAQALLDLLWARKNAAHCSLSGFAQNRHGCVRHPTIDQGPGVPLMELFAQSTFCEVADGLTSGGGLTVAHFEALRQSLSLPLTSVIDDVLTFQIGDGMTVTAMLSEEGGRLLLVDLIDIDPLPLNGWQRIVSHLASRLHDDTVGTLLVLDNKLSMVWVDCSEAEPLRWVQEVRRAMLWCLRARKLIDEYGLLSVGA